MSIPDGPHRPFYEIGESVNFKKWFSNFNLFQEDVAVKQDLGIYDKATAYAPERWYGRVVFGNLYAKVDRDSPKFFMTLGIDYESLILGLLYGSFMAFRRFMDYNFGKCPQYRPVECCCSGQEAQLYERWWVTHTNPRKLFKYDRRLFWRKLNWGTSFILNYAIAACVYTHVYSALTFKCIERHVPIFWAGLFTTYFLYYEADNYINVDSNYIDYRRPSELMVFGALTFYSICRLFRNYIGNIPTYRVLYN